MIDSSEKFVLYVEDNEDDVDLTVLCFKERRFPYPLRIVRDGAEALDFLFATGKHSGRDKSQAPLLVLLDLNIPKVHGLDVLAKIRSDRSLKHLVVVVLTSSVEEMDHVAARTWGANLYIQKPVNFDDFNQVAERIENLIVARS